MEPKTGTPTLVQSGSVSNGNEEVFHISQRSRIEASPLDGLMTHISRTFIGGGSYTSVEMLSVYSPAANIEHNHYERHITFPSP